MAEIETSEAIAGAAGLMMAGRWDLADRLLDAVRTGTARERAALALARARNAVERDMRCLTGAAQALDAATSLVAGTGDEQAGWDLEWLRLRCDYWAELFPAGAAAPADPAERDPAAAGALAARAARLRETAPDRPRAGWAAFYSGTIADNLRGEGDRAAELFREARAAGEESGDGELLAEALRHLGYHADQAGDPAAAREHWIGAAELRQRTGNVPGVLSQQVLLAGLAAQEGDRAGGRALAAEVRRWAASLGMGWLEADAARIAAG